MTCVPLAEKEDDLILEIIFGPKDIRPDSTMSGALASSPTQDQKYWMMCAKNQATPTQSAYILRKKLPSELIFGVSGSSPQFHLKYDVPSQSYKSCK